MSNYIQQTELSSLTADMPASLLTNNLANNNSYYRSKAFTSKIGVNPLTTAASTILSIAGRIPKISSFPEQKDLLSHLSHEIYAFENTAQSHQYQSDQIQIAKYILCSTLDDILTNTPWGKQNDWGNQGLLHSFYNEQDGNTRFFTILQRLSLQPKQHIDLLELIYLTLSAGFEGKYRLSTVSKSELDRLMDELYQCIQEQRNYSKKLPFAKQQKKTASIKNTDVGIPFWLTASVTLALLFTLYCTFNFVLHLNLAPLTNAIERMIVSTGEGETHA